ncbi:MAG: hypothetical protein IPF58_09680 [Saprospirales bacterium]|nr:hypothetical protein [Saprospirales bacterium]
MVASVNKRMDKKAGLGQVLLFEDLDATLEIAFFSENYNKYIAFLEVGNRLLLKGFYKTSYRDPEKYELNVTQMEFMQDVLEKYGKGMRVMLDYNKLDEQK